MMKQGIKVLFLLVHFFFSTCSFYAQSFEGKITCQFFREKIDQELKGMGEEFFGVDFFPLGDTSVIEYLIKEDYLISTEFNKNREVKWTSFQKNDSAFVQFPSGKNANFTSLRGGEKDIQLVKVYKERKIIMGFVCKKVEYLQKGRTDEMKIIAWIAEDFIYDKTNQTTKIFSDFILPDGLALEKIIKFKELENVFRVTKIEHFNIDIKDMVSQFENK